MITNDKIFLLQGPSNPQGNEPTIHCIQTRSMTTGQELDDIRLFARPHAPHPTAPPLPRDPPTYEESSIATVSSLMEIQFLSLNEVVS